MNPLIEDIEQYLRRTYLPKRSERKALEAYAEGAGLISKAFTADRPELPKNYFNKPEYRSGYLLYFVAANHPKIAQCLRLSGAVERCAGQANVDILDLGCGPATGALAAADVWQAHAPKQKLSILGVDQNKKILADAKGLFMSRGYSNARLRTVAADVGPGRIGQILKTQQFDVIICANLLNEFANMEHRERIVQNLLKRYLKPHGVLIIIEPALQESTRNLMQLRDSLLEVSSYRGDEDEPNPLPRKRRTPSEHVHVIAPCLHQDACPMLSHGKRDWCHAYMQWSRPRVIAHVDKLIGNQKDYLKFSYLILGLPKAKTNTEPGDTQYRVVSSRIPSKGRSQILLCPDDSVSTAKLLKVERLDRDVSPSNEDYDHTLRGDIVQISDPERISKKGTFKITEAFQANRKRARPAKAKRRAYGA